MRTIRILAALALISSPVLAQQAIVAPRLAAVTQPPAATHPGEANTPSTLVRVEPVSTEMYPSESRSIWPRNSSVAG